MAGGMDIIYIEILDLEVDVVIDKILSCRLLEKEGLYF